MSTNTHLYSATTTDLQGGITRSTQSLNETGGWYFKQVATYTSLAPLTVLDGATAKLVIPIDDVGYEQSKLLDIEYNYITQRFMPVESDDMYITSLRGKVKPTAQAGYVETILSSPNTIFNPLDAATLTFSKSANEEQFLSQAFLIFTSPDVVTNGVEVFVNPINTDIQIYDYSFTICRLFSNKGINK